MYTCVTQTIIKIWNITISPESSLITCQTLPSRHTVNHFSDRCPHSPSQLVLPKNDIFKESKYINVGVVETWKGEELLYELIIRMMAEKPERVVDEGKLKWFMKRLMTWIEGNAGKYPQRAFCSASNCLYCFAQTVSTWKSRDRGFCLVVSKKWHNSMAKTSLYFVKVMKLKYGDCFTCFAFVIELLTVWLQNDLL